MNLAEKLTVLRKQKGLTQMELAEQLNVSRQAISRWEVGAAVPSIDNLKILGDLYEVSVDFLLNDDSDGICKKDEEAQDPTTNIQQKKEIRKKHRGIYIGVAITFVLLAVITSIVISSRKKQSQSLPIEKMTVVEEDSYTNYTFSIG